MSEDISSQSVDLMPPTTPDHAAELRRLQDRVRFAASSARMGIWEYDFERQELWVSDELAGLYGRSADEMTWDQFASMVHPDDMDGQLEQTTPSFPFGETNEFLIRVRHADGRYRTIRSRSTTFGDEFGRPIRKAGAHIDMSGDALLELNAELQEANARLHHFIKVATHDLRSPMRVVRGLLDVVCHDRDSVLTDEAQNILQAARHRIGIMDRLVVDVLKFASSPVDEVGLTDIDTQIEEIASSVDAGSCDIVHSTDIDAPVPVSRVPLLVVIRNLVDNACKHNARNDGLVEIESTLDGCWLKVVVQDNGPGIDPADHAKIFDPFVTTDVRSHSGLGLANARNIVDEYEAVLTLDSTIGAGARFELLWPVAEAD